MREPRLGSSDGPRAPRLQGRSLSATAASDARLAPLKDMTSLKDRKLYASILAAGPVNPPNQRIE
jgi:hypothetical protein